MRRRVQPNANFEFPIKDQNAEVQWFKIRVQQVTFIIQNWLNQKRKAKGIIQFNTQDAARLLKLDLFALTYKVEIAEILDLVVPVLRSRRSTLQRKYTGRLGVTVPMLTGLAAERILQQELHKRYPDQSHVDYYTEEQREADLLREWALEDEEDDGIPVKDKGSSLFNYKSLKAYTQAYDQQVDAERERRNKAYGQKWRRRKKYRSNPWI